MHIDLIAMKILEISRRTINKLFDLVFNVKDEIVKVNFSISVENGFSSVSIPRIILAFWNQKLQKLSTSIYDLVLLDVCHFHHCLLTFPQICTSSRYSCSYLGSCIQEFWIRYRPGQLNWDFWVLTEDISQCGDLLAIFLTPWFYVKSILADFKR